MQKKKKQQLKSEVGKFSFVGVISTVLDYTILNGLVFLLHTPVLAANLVSTTAGGIVSYQLNKKHTFEGRRHSRKKALLIYILITGTGIYIIQNGLLVIFQKPLIPLADAVAPAIRLDPQIVDVNLAKMLGGVFAAIWNYLMLRRFVFVPETQKEDVQVAD